MKGKLRLGATLLAGVLTLAGCADPVNQAKEQAAGLKNQVENTVKDLSAALGKEAASLEQVNSRLVQGAGKVIAVLKELQMSLDYNENGIQFRGQNLKGVIGLNGDTLFLDVRSSAKDGNTVQSMVRLANVFSPDNTIEDRLNAAMGKDEVQTHRMNNGYIETGKDYIHLYLESFLR